MGEFIIHPLTEQGRSLPPDCDHLLAKIQPAQLLLINITPGVYAYEHHPCSEYLLCMSGRLILETDTGLQASISQGQMIEIPPGLKHRFAAESDAVIVTVAQTPAA